MKKIILAVTLALSAASAYALDLTEAVNLALKNNDSIKEQRALLEAQGYSGRTAVSAFLPSAGLNYSYADTTAYGWENTGGSESSSLKVDMTYNLFNGFSDWNNYKLSSNALTRQGYTYRSNTQEIILAVKNAYINYLKATNDLDVATRTLELLEEQRRITLLRIKAGELQQSDLLKIDVQLASTKLDLLNARISVRNSRRQLERYISRNIGDGETVEQIVINDDYFIPSLIELQNRLEENRSEILYARVTYDAAALIKDMGKGSFLPKLNIGLSYGFYGDHGDPFGNRDSNYNSNRVLSLTASWNLFNGFSDMNTYRAKAKTADASAYALSDLRQRLHVELAEVYEEYFSAQERISVAAAGVNDAQESYRVTELQFQYSEATTSDLLDASVSLNRALTSLTKANYDLIAAVAEIERAVEDNFLGLAINIEN